MYTGGMCLCVEGVGMCVSRVYVIATGRRKLKMTLFK